jgi:hypothetical protein
MDSEVPFATAVQAVVDTLTADGQAIVEATMHANELPHVVATRDDELLFVLVQGLEGPNLAEFSEELYYGQIRPFVDSLTWHPRGSALAERAAQFGAQVMLAMVALMETGDVDAEGDRLYLAKAFPLRDVDPGGLVAPIDWTDDAPRDR